MPYHWVPMAGARVFMSNRSQASAYRPASGSAAQT